MLLDAVEPKRAARPGDVVLDVGSFAAQLVWFDDEAGDVSRHDHYTDKIDRGGYCDGYQKQAQSFLRQSVHNGDDRRDEQSAADKEQRRQEIVRLCEGD